MLGKARLDHEQLRTCLSHLGNVINERPLTVMTEDQDDLIPLCPALFTRGIRSAAWPKGEEFTTVLTDYYKRRQTLQQELRDRFRKEYLFLLVQRAKEKVQRLPVVGEVVLVGADDQK